MVWTLHGNLPWLQIAVSVMSRVVPPETLGTKVMWSRAKLTLDFAVAYWQH